MPTTQFFRSPALAQSNLCIHGFVIFGITWFLRVRCYFIDIFHGYISPRYVLLTLRIIIRSMRVLLLVFTVLQQFILTKGVTKSSGTWTSRKWSRDWKPRGRKEWVFSFLFSSTKRIFPITSISQQQTTYFMDALGHISSQTINNAYDHGNKGLRFYFDLNVFEGKVHEHKN